MIEETGQVVALDGDVVWVRAASRADCQRCREGRGCGGGLIAALLGNRLSTVAARAGDEPLEVGDRVRLGLPGGALVAAAGAVYLLPLAGLLLTLSATHAAWPDLADGWAALAGLGGLAAGIAAARALAARGGARPWRPRVVRRLTAAEEKCA